MINKTIKPTFKDKVVSFFDNNKIFVLFWVVIVTFASFSTFLKDSNYLVNYINQTINKKGVIYKKINSLTTDVDINKYIEVLGSPTKRIMNKSKEVDYIFTDKMYYITATTNSDNYVISFTITSRNNDFQPTLSRSISEYKDMLYKVTLNKDSFADLDKNTQGGISCLLNIWAQGYNYSEGHYLANSGNYQTVFFGINDQGYLDSVKGFPGDIYGGIFNDCSQIPNEFRKNKVNTFSLDKRMYFNKDNPFIGVNKEEIGLAK